jgi:glycosyltransferase 2 family protein
MVNRHSRAYITIAISIVLSIFLFKFFIKNVDINFLWTCVKSSNLFFIVMGGLLLLMSHYLRAIRWTILLKPIESVKITSSFTAILIGTLSNFVVPHVGEVIRCSVLKKMEQIRIELSIGTVIAERVLDVLFLSVLIFLGLILNVDALNVSVLNVSWMGNTPVFMLFLVVATVVILGFILKKRIIENISENLNQKITNVKKGLSTIKEIEHLNAFILLSFTIWTLYFLSTYFLIKAIIPTQYIGFKVVLTVLIMSSIGFAGPTQGGIGTFHILVSKALIINGFDVETSHMVSLFLHTVFSSYDLIYGVIATCSLYFFRGHASTISNPLAT